MPQNAPNELPRNGDLLRLATQFPTNTELADHLGVPRTTLRDHIARLGMRESVAAARGHERVPRPTEIPIIHRDYTDQAHHKVYPLGDVHIGDPMHNRHIWQQWVSFLVEHDDCSLMGTGDFLNSALKNSPPNSYDEQVTVEKGKRILRDQLMPIKDRIDVLMPGNHEAWIHKAVGDCPIHDVADWVGAPYVKAAALIVYHVGDQEYEIYVRHSATKNVSTLWKSEQVIRADVYVTAHTHRQAVTLDDRFVRKGEDALPRLKFYCVSSGSFLAYARYAAERGYPPTHLGAPRVWLDGRRRDFHVSI